MLDGSLMPYTNAIFAVGVNPCVDIFQWRHLCNLYNWQIDRLLVNLQLPIKRIIIKITQSAIFAPTVNKLWNWKMSIMRNGAEKDAVRWCHLIILIILGIYYMLFLPKVQGAHSLLQAYKKLQIHCCNTLLQNIVTVTEHWQNIAKTPTHGGKK